MAERRAPVDNEFTRWAAGLRRAYEERRARYAKLHPPRLATDEILLPLEGLEPEFERIGAQVLPVPEEPE